MSARPAPVRTGGEYSSVDDVHVLAAIELSEDAAARGDYPFGAVLVDAAGDVVAAAGNTMVKPAARERSTASSSITVAAPRSPRRRLAYPELHAAKGRL